MLVHSGWMVESQEITRLSEVHQEYRLPPGTATLFDFYTSPEARGRGLYRQALQQMLVEAAGLDGVRQIWIGVLADNGPSRHVIEKVGFRYEVSLFESRRFGRWRRWRQDVRDRPATRD